MTELKLGDVVILTEKYDKAEAGTIGEIIDDTTDQLHFGLRILTKPFNSGHTCTGSAPNNDGYWVHRSKVKLLNWKERLKIVNGGGKQWWK